MKKFILLGLGGAILITIGLVITIVMSIDSIIETAVNDYGPKVTQTDVKLDSADIGIFDMSGKLSGLTVGNPVNRGFKPRDLFAMDQVRVSIDKDSLATDTIVIKEVAIIAPKIAYELKDFSESNFDALLKNIKESTGAGQGSTKEEAPAEGEAEAGKEKKLIIENLIVSGAEVTADMTGLPGEGLTLPLPDIHLKDIGKEDGGASPAETAEILISAVYEAMQKAFAESGDFIMKGGKWIMEGADAAVEEATKAAEDIANEAGSALDDAGKALEEGVGKLF